MTTSITYSQIRTLQQQGQLETAITLCQQTLETSFNVSIEAILGTLYCQNKDFDAGRACLDKVLSSSETFNNQTRTDIAGIHILLGEPTLALQQLDKVLANDSDFILAIIRRGLIQMQVGKFEKAISDITKGLAILPPNQHLPLHINLARCSLSLGDTDTALTQIELAKKQGGNRLEQWLLVSVDTYIALDRWEDAEAAIQQALESGTHETNCIKLLALVLAAQDKHDEAEHHIRTALKKNPEDIELLTQLSSLANIRGHYGESLHCLLSATKVEPENASLWAQLAQLGKRHFDADRARHAAEKALELTEDKIGLERAEALVAIASVESDAGEQEQAEKYYLEALELVPSYISACLGLGHLLLQWGRVEEAVAQFEEVTARHPVAGYGALISARKFPDDEAILANIEKMAYIPSLQGPVQSSLLFDLASAWEHKKDYKKAFHFIREANTASRKYLPYSAEKHREECLALMQTFTADFYAQRTDYGLNSTLPVFVLGMPRSGTTLVEQILGGHPKIFGAGELGILGSVIQRLNAWERHVGSGKQYPECLYDFSQEQSQLFAEEVLTNLQAYSPESNYVIDKMPHNFESIGLIRLLFPKAPIIHVLRDPRDVAISNYFTDYQAKFGGMGFAYDLEDIGKQLVDYKTLIAHWNDVVPHPILTVRYEDVVDDAEAQARRMLDYIGVDWTDEVMNYQNLDRAVKTASVWQVRQPIYKTSKQKWRRYQEYIKPLETQLNTEIEPPELKAETHLPAGLFFDGMECLKETQGKQAAVIFEKILANNPNHIAATHMLGVAMLQQGKKEQALTLMEDSIKRHPNHVGWYQNISLAYQALGLFDKAQQATNKANTLKTLDVSEAI